jgi:hypothetical protein
MQTVCAASAQVIFLVAAVTNARAGLSQAHYGKKGRSPGRTLRTMMLFAEAVRPTITNMITPLYNDTTDVVTNRDEGMGMEVAFELSPCSEDMTSTVDGHVQEAFLCYGMVAWEGLATLGHPTCLASRHLHDDVRRTARSRQL